jgi:hypothetical protein
VCEHVSMRAPAKPHVSFSARLDIETAERRRRLERHFGCSAPELLRQMFLDFETGVLRRLSGDERRSYLNQDFAASDRRTRAS